MRTTIESMLREIQERKDTNHDDLLAKYVQVRLESSLRNYYKDLLDSYNVLTHHDGQNVLRQLGKQK